MYAGDCSAKRKRPRDTTKDLSDQQDLPAWLSSPAWQSVGALDQVIRGAIADHAGPGTHITDTSGDRLAEVHRTATVGMTEAGRQGYFCTASHNTGAQHGGGSAAADDRVAARQQRVKKQSAPMAVSGNTHAEPDAEADQHNPIQADKQPKVAAAAAAEGHQQHQHMSASSAVAQEPNQAPPAVPTAPVVTSIRKLKAEARPLMKAVRTARGGQLGSGLPEGGQQGSELPQGTRQGPGEGFRPESREAPKKLNQARIQEEEQGPSHAYRYLCQGAVLLEGYSPQMLHALFPHLFACKA